jgi:hypothetical protein
MPTQTQTFWFNTGVVPWKLQNPPFRGCYGCERVRGGTIQIPVEVEEVPPGSRFEYAVSTLTDRDRSPHLLVRPILNHGEKGSLISKFAIFRLPEKQ